MNMAKANIPIPPIRMAISENRITSSIKAMSFGIGLSNYILDTQKYLLGFRIDAVLAGIPVPLVVFLAGNESITSKVEGR